MLCNWNPENQETLFLSYLLSKFSRCNLQWLFSPSEKIVNSFSSFGFQDCVCRMHQPHRVVYSKCGWALQIFLGSILRCMIMYTRVFRRNFGIRLIYSSWKIRVVKVLRKCRKTLTLLENKKRLRNEHDFLVRIFSMSYVGSRSRDFPFLISVQCTLKSLHE